MRRYPEYKESSVEWIGEIPKHWEVVRSKHLFGNRNQRGYEGEPLLSVTQDRGILPRNELDYRVWNPEGNVRLYKLVRPGDWVISLRTFEGGIELSEVRGIVSAAYTTMFPQRQIFNSYFKHLLKSVSFIAELNRITTGIRQGKNISYEDFSDTRVTFPPLNEQKAIGNFLDRKTGQIDELIRIKERQVELLQEQRTVLINQAVTKGLDPNVEMKPSGIEWIGEIPKHWEAIPIKHTLQIAKDSIRTGPFGSSLKSHEFQDKGIRVYNQQSVYNEDFSKSDIFISEEKFNELRSYIVQPKDVLITSRGTIGKMTIVPKNGEIGVLHPCLIRLRLNENKLIPKYLWWYVNHSSFFIESVKIESNSTTIEVIYSETLSSVKIPIPTVKEQLEILEFLNVKIPIIDTTISNARKGIELLKEYRQSLISEVVTGKIDVRNEV